MSSWDEAVLDVVFLQVCQLFLADVCEEQEGVPADVAMFKGEAPA